MASGATCIATRETRDLMLGAFLLPHSEPTVMWSGVFSAVSCVTDTVKKSLLKATGPLPGRGTWAHTVRGLYLDEGRCGLADNPDLGPHCRTSPQAGEDHRASARRTLTSANGRFKTSDKKLSFTDTRRAENSRK